MANRIAYYLMSGIDPADKLVCHKCDNPPCCNPAHYFLGDCAANMRDAVEKGRMWTGTHENKQGWRRGAEQHLAKLTDEQVIEIRHLFKRRSRDFGRKGLAARFGVSPNTIKKIIRRDTWTHI